MTWPRLRYELDRTPAWWIANLFLWLVAAHLAHLFAVRHIDWGTTGPRFSFRYVETNLPVNGWFYLYDERFPMAFTALAVAGLFFGRHARERLAIASYFLLFFAVDLLFYAGSYNYGADVRYSLMTFPPIAMLGGLGAAGLVRLIARRGMSLGLPASTRVPVRALVVAILLFQFLWYTPVVRATTEEAWAARADVRFAQAFAGEIPAQFVRADAQSRDVPSVGRQCGTDVARHLEPGVRALSRRPLQRRRVSALEFLVQRTGSAAAGDLPQRHRDWHPGTGQGIP